MKTNEELQAIASNKPHHSNIHAYMTWRYACKRLGLPTGHAPVTPLKILERNRRYQEKKRQEKLQQKKQQEIEEKERSKNQESRS